MGMLVQIARVLRYFSSIFFSRVIKYFGESLILELVNARVGLYFPEE
jgi:hypothetical protein